MAERLPNPRWGAMNFAQDPTTAVGFLGFIKTAQSMVGIIGNIFELGPDFVMPRIFRGPLPNRSAIRSVFNSPTTPSF
jgi:hypothetical protein